MLRDTQNGFWAAFLMVFLEFPLSLYKEISSLRYACMAGVAITFYISAIITMEPLVGDINGHSLMDNLQACKIFDFKGVYL